ncbi:hypothetical protein [Modestobacter sp. Leaf380]|uniref:hypothetical protein n=1 Tax=Modestobacter sp. Leaf380 TaxID=1736356 RepID=UPI0006F60BBA|nr:hypothetical protein [Modestobacter sp. Leaf380]KQS69171.1 hypothetical protein ASG41_22100 [Modestobacter sp. Leaf380]
MRRPPLLLLAGVLPLTACTSFAASSPAASTPSGSSATTTATPTTPTTPAGDLEVLDETDLGTAATGVTAARVVVSPDGTPTTLVVSASTSAVRTGGTTTLVEGTVLADLVATARGTVAVTLTAEAAPTDPVLGVLPLAAAEAPNGDGVTAAPVPLSPEQTAPRGLPVFAALSPGGDVLYVLAESTDAVGATVYAVDPTTGALQDSAEVDTGFTDVTALALGGLAVTGDGDLVVGLSLDSDDPLAGGGTAAPLLRLDADLRPSGVPVDTQEGAERAEVLAVTADAGGGPLAVVSDARSGLRLVDPDLDAGTTTDEQVAGADVATRAGSLAADADRAVVALLDQEQPTVAVVPSDGSPATTLQLCADAGDALSVSTTGDGFVVLGTCDGATVLWTLG